MDTVSLVIKNADGITPDTSLEEMPVDYTTVGDVKTKLREIIAGGPDETRMKLVFSGRFGCPPLPLGAGEAAIAWCANRPVESRKSEREEGGAGKRGHENRE